MGWQGRLRQHVAYSFCNEMFLICSTITNHFDWRQSSQPGNAVSCFPANQWRNFSWTRPRNSQGNAGKNNSLCFEHLCHCLKTKLSGNAKFFSDCFVHSLSEVESSRTFLASRTSSRTHFEVLGLGLEASSPWKLACPRLEDSAIFWIIKILWSAWKIFWKTFFCEDRLKNFCEDLFFFEIAWKMFVKTFFLESTCACVLGPWPWPRAFLSLASRVSVLGNAVLGLGLGFFLCPWPWALCPRLHLCSLCCFQVKDIRWSCSDR